MPGPCGPADRAGEGGLSAGEVRQEGVSEQVAAFPQRAVREIAGSGAERDERLPLA